MDSFNAQQYQQIPGASWNPFPNAMFFAPPPGIPPPPFNFDPRTIPPPPFFFPPNYPHAVPHPPSMSTNSYFHPNQSFNVDRNYFDGSNMTNGLVVNNHIDVQKSIRPDHADDVPALREWLEARRDLRAARGPKKSKWTISVGFDCPTMLSLLICLSSYEIVL